MLLPRQFRSDFRTPAPRLWRAHHLSHRSFILICQRSRAYKPSGLCACWQQPVALIVSRCRRHRNFWRPCKACWFAAGSRCRLRSRRMHCIAMGRRRIKGLACSFPRQLPVTRGKSCLPYEPSTSIIVQQKSDNLLVQDVEEISNFFIVVQVLHKGLAASKNNACWVCAA